ncbi:hypothetical protein ACFPXP_06805 [Marinicrinis lubricantis]|uniref:Uncharacterized protein n=1 Tax=Marinicrinis lubricantis TaxID=2086470 RepID=A0ABW1IM81_9BACL
MSQARLLSLQAECSLYFEENPYSIENEQGLALRLGRRREDLMPVLERLTSLSILQRVGEGEHAYYKYNQPDVIEKVVVWESQ